MIVRRVWWRLLPLVLLLAAAPAARGDSPFAGLIRMLDSGRVPEERQGNIVDVLCSQGSTDDLGYVFERVVGEQPFGDPLRRQALAGLEEAARARKQLPAGDLTRLKVLFSAETEPALRQQAVELAGLWKVTALSRDLAALSLAEGTPAALRQEVVKSLAMLGDPASRAAILALTAAERPAEVRVAAVAALAGFDPAAAAPLAAEVLAGVNRVEQAEPLLEAFLNKKGADAPLAAELKEKPLPVDAAKLALRYLYSVGRTENALLPLLSEAAGIDADAPPPSDEEIAALAEEAARAGDPARGELVFRRRDLSCVKCHAVNGVGGAVGPDLGPLGGSSPIVYIAESILAPDKAVKEEFQAETIYTLDGRVVQGIVRGEEGRLVVHDANGSVTILSEDDVDERLKGRSLMPKGLVNLMTRQELLDLTRFVAELGRPGEYAIPTEPLLRRWQLFTAMPELEPNPDTFVEEVAASTPEAWESAYGLVNGRLPLTEFAERAGREVFYLRTELETTQAGEVAVEFDSLAGVSAWLDGDPLTPAGERLGLPLSEERHELLLRVDTRARGLPSLRGVLREVPGSNGKAKPVGGA